jgi:hypothetical protein
MRAFVSEGFREYAGDRVVNGLHLRVSPKEIQDALRRYCPPWQLVSDGIPLDWLVHSFFGLSSTGRVLGDKTGVRTLEYDDKRPLKVEAIIDIDPRSWSEDLTEPRQTDFGTVRLRRASPATSHLGTGDVIFDRGKGRDKHGTVAGIFRSGAGADYALTCGHVAKANASVSSWDRRPWYRPWAKESLVGKVAYASLPPVHTGTRWHETAVDAALIPLQQVSTGMSRHSPAAPRAVAAMIQEEPVHFHSGSRHVSVRARVAGVTIWKAIDLYGKDQMYDLGDVLMLGHPHHMYGASTVSRPGDSGAAVQGGWPSANTRPPADWYAMIIGSDQSGAYATYAESVWRWAGHQIDDGELDFYYN